MKEIIQKDLSEALKNNLGTKVSVLRGFLAVLQNKEKEKKYQKKEEKLTDQEILKVLFSEAKKREESIEAFKKGNRPELAEKEEKELEILKKYLPEPLPEKELKEIIEKAIEKTGASELKDMKKIMAEVMPQVGQRARGDQISKIAKDKLCR